MQKLHLVGVTTDHQGLIFSVRRGTKSGGFVVPLTDDLVEAINDVRTRRDEREDDTDAARTRARSRSALSVREIQARLRVGRSIDEVAREAGVEPEWVERFAAPVIAEQAQVITAARSTRFVKRGRGESATPLADAVRRNLGDKNVLLTDDEFDQAWSTYQLQDDVWLVFFGYRNRGQWHEAVWEFDRHALSLGARDRLATQLGYVEPGTLPLRPRAPRRAPAPARPAPPRPEPLRVVAPPPPEREERPATRRARKKKAAPRKPAARTTAATRKKKAARTTKAARKTTATRKATPARKTTAKRKAAPAKRKATPARKATAKRKATPARKAPAKRTSAKRAPAKRSTAKRKATPAKKAPAARGAAKKRSTSRGGSARRLRFGEPSREERSGRAAPRAAAVETPPVTRRANLPHPEPQPEAPTSRAPRDTGAVRPATGALQRPPGFEPAPTRPAPPAGSGSLPGAGGGVTDFERSAVFRTGMARPAANAADDDAPPVPPTRSRRLLRARRNGPLRAR